MTVRNARNTIHSSDPTDHTVSRANVKSAACGVERLEERVLFDTTAVVTTTVGALGGRRSFDDYVDVYLDHDYTFTMRRAGTFDARMTGLSLDADLYLFDNAGREVGHSTNLLTADESISRSLPAGKYTLEAAWSDGSTGYHLTLTSDFAGDTRAAARDLGTVGPSRTVNDYVGPDDVNDLYRFHVAEPGATTLSLSGLSADANVFLLDDAGQPIASSTNGGTAGERLTRSLRTGTYYVLVKPSGNASTNYALTLSGPVDNAGNSRSAAKGVGGLSGTAKALRGWVGLADPDDDYRFTVAAGRTIHLGLTGLATDANLQLLGSAGATLATSSHAGTAGESINYFTATGGTFYARVYRSSGDTFYNLCLRAT